jgi:hypothetical protein
MIYVPVAILAQLVVRRLPLNLLLPSPHKMATPVAKRARTEPLDEPLKIEVFITNEALDELDEQAEADADKEAETLLVELSTKAAQDQALSEFEEALMAYAAHRAAVDAEEAILETARQTTTRIASFTKPKEEQTDDAMKALEEIRKRNEQLQGRLKDFQPRPTQPREVPPLHVIEPDYADAPRIRSPTRPPAAHRGGKDKDKGKGKGFEEEEVPVHLPPQRQTLPRGQAPQIPCACGRPGALAMHACINKACGDCCTKVGKPCEGHRLRELEKATRQRSDRGGRTPSKASSWSTTSWSSTSWSSTSWSSDAWGTDSH